MISDEFEKWWSEGNIPESVREYYQLDLPVFREVIRTAFLAGGLAALDNAKKQMEAP